MTLSTLHGWLPTVGSLVWQQMYDPQRPKHDSSIEERIAAGAGFYGKRRLMRVHSVTPDSHGPGIHRFALGEPDRHGPTSWTESDWCVLEDAAAEEGALF